MINNNLPETIAKPRPKHGRKGMKCSKNGRPLKHGAVSFLRTGCVPAGKGYLLDMAEAMIAQIAGDMGGIDSLSGNQVVILREIKQNLVYKFLCDEYVAQQGLFLSNGKMQPCMDAFYLSCSNSIVRACRELGLKRVEGKEMSLETYIKTNYPEPDTPAKSATDAQEAQGGTISNDHGIEDGK